MTKRNPPVDGFVRTLYIFAMEKDRDIKKLLADYPHVNLDSIVPFFPKISLNEYPELDHYSWEDCHKGFLGAGGLFLTNDMAQQLQLHPGMRVLDLCAGNCSSSIFLAKHYDVNVFAVDLYADIDKNFQRIQEAQLEDRITPLHAAAHDMFCSSERP